MIFKDARELIPIATGSEGAKLTNKPKKLCAFATLRAISLQFSHKKTPKVSLSRFSRELN